MSIITVDTIKAHIRARIAAGDEYIKEMQAFPMIEPTLSIAVKLVETRNRAFRELLKDIDREVLMSEDNTEPINDDIYHRND